MFVFNNLPSDPNSLWRVGSTISSSNTLPSPHDRSMRFGDRDTFCLSDAGIKDRRLAFSKVQRRADSDKREVRNLRLERLI